MNGAADRDEPRRRPAGLLARLLLAVCRWACRVRPTSRPPAVAAFTAGGVVFVVSADGVEALRRTGLPIYRAARSVEDLCDLFFGPRWLSIVLVLIAEQLPPEMPFDRLHAGLVANRRAVERAVMRAVVAWYVRLEAGDVVGR